MTKGKKNHGGKRQGAGRKQILETEFKGLRYGEKTKSDRSYCTNVRLPSLDASFVKTLGGGAFLRSLYIQWLKTEEGQKAWDAYLHADDGLNKLTEILISKSSENPL